MKSLAVHSGHQGLGECGQQVLLESWGCRSLYDGSQVTYIELEHSDGQCTPRVSVQRLSLKDEGVSRACDIRDFSPRSPCLHHFWL